VASDTAVASGDERSSQFGALFKFQQVFHEEIARINQRRALRKDPLGAIRLEHEAKDASGEWVWRPAQEANVVGLALSGGGIRSAAFCLGVLQALDTTKVLDRVDYMSTVSGGGYIGCSLTAAQEWSGQNRAPVFPFTSRLEEDEPPALQHIRDHSNYLFPHGAIDFLHNASIYARGLIANAIIVAPFILVGSVLTLLWYVLRAHVWQTILSLLNPYRLKHFFFTIDLGLLLILVGIVWAIVQSTRRRRLQTEIPGAWTLLVGIVVIAFLVVAFCDLQPFVLDAMVRAGSGDTSAVVANWVNAVAAVLAPIGAVIAFLASKLGEYVKSAFESPKWSAYIKGLVAKAAIYVGGLIVPLLIWVVYLDITYWGLCINVRGLSCVPPAWLDTASHRAFDWSGQPATALYLAAAICFFILTLLMQPNANSLHPLYRDRLAKAFLLNPKRRPGRSDADLEEYRPRLSQITSLYGPYHLINTALNVQASKTANRRGRNADFFIFSPKFVGSKSTDYVATEDIEDVAIGLDLATAMAASGAAVSSNMGAQSIKPLTATLALLNIRLGYWLRNPLRVTKAGAGHAAAGERHFVADFFRVRNVFANYYFLGEVFGRLSERRKSVYLTDGGHIENLGIYELLRRRCRVIIAVDAEADPQMAFGSFNALERYALIDLGVRIDLPWQQIADESLTTGEAIDSKSDAPKDNGPHCAIGEISYPRGRKGILIYVKASLTGDENDYVFDYKKRYDAFPHETTLDQWFSEEQFEAYRALGFHAAYRLFDRSDRFAHRDPQQNLDVEPHIGLLDQLFPRVETGGPPGQKQTFADWLPGDEGPHPGASGTDG
jgi:predicted acylesterase/phospholipase RssA